MRFLPFAGLFLGGISELMRARRRLFTGSRSRAVMTGRGGGL